MLLKRCSFAGVNHVSSLNVLPVLYNSPSKSSTKHFICYSCGSMSKKEIQSAATSSLMGCDGPVESSNVAVLAVLGYIQPPSKSAWLALRNWRAGNASPAAGSWAVPAQLFLLFPRLPSGHAPSTQASWVRQGHLQTFEEEGKKAVECIVLTSAPAQRKGVSGPEELGGKI